MAKENVKDVDFEPVEELKTEVNEAMEKKSTSIWGKVKTFCTSDHRAVKVVRGVITFTVGAATGAIAMLAYGIALSQNQNGCEELPEGEEYYAEEGNEPEEIVEG